MLRIGTSGWHYKDWRGVFYPDRMPARDYLAYYAQSFDTVELNGVFYQLPTTEAVKEWYRIAPKDFLFAYKGSRFITHMKKLKDPDAALEKMFSRARFLRNKMAVVLWQLPPFFNRDVARLESFFEALPKSYRYVMEFRNASWYTPEVFKLLEHWEIGLCLHDMRDEAAPLVVTSQTVYVRFHGTTEQKYHGLYTDLQIRQWAGRIHAWRRQKLDVFVYFNNDYEGHAITNARQLRGLLKEESDAQTSIERQQVVSSSR